MVPIAGRTGSDGGRVRVRVPATSTLLPPSAFWRGPCDRDRAGEPHGKLLQPRDQRAAAHGRVLPPGGDRPALREAAALRTRIDARPPPRRTIPTTPNSALHERTGGIGLSPIPDRKSTRLNSSHDQISYA